ncbi:MAG TPA: type VI secretion system tip protein TssI/VgrG [Polyangium sp.]|nr:type VI secretion system tip protein TssI/VgrG [Polyangium sp.]
MPELTDYVHFTFKIEGLSAATYVAQFEGTEAVSELFQFEVSLTTEEKDISFADVVGKAAVLSIQTDKGAPRHVHGTVGRFRHVDDGKQVSVYQATLVPKLWRLRLRHDSRIFQGLSVPEIITKVLEGAGLAGGDYRLSLSGSHPAREYCVQYRESDFAFISRLMEEEGIYYFFEHTEDNHVLVMADAKDAPAPITAPDTLAFRPALGAMARSESVSRFSRAEEVRPGKVTLSDFNFKKPGLSLLGSSQAEIDSDLEVYDYPGEYELPSEGGALAKVRLEEWQARRVVVDGESGCIRMTPGYVFTLSDHAREAENKAYLITRVLHRGGQPQMAEAASGAFHGYTNTFQCMPIDVPFRPERVTPRPTIKGVQTAIVTGPGGEEVHTDEHGRVKVHFHWDRQGGMNEKSSCWIRVSQIWAGGGYGGMWIPRVGHEVVVDFIEGDPDRPLVVGRVYHGANVPPYPLPAEKTKSTIKSNSSKGGGGYNELRFEDKKGQEEVYLQGEKDWKILIKHDKHQVIGNDEALDVGHDRKKHVGHDQSETVDHDKKIQVGNDHTENIDGNATIHVGKDHTENVDGKESLTIGKTRDVTVGSDQTTSIGGNHAITVSKSHDETIAIAMTLNVGAASMENVGAAKSLNVGAAYAIEVGAMMSTSVGASQSTSVGSNQSTSVGGNQSTSVGKNQSTNVDGEMSVIVAKKVVVTCGSASITLEKNGKITVSGKDITVNGTGNVSVKAKNVNVKSDGKVSVQASGNVAVKGSKVNMN